MLHELCCARLPRPALAALAPWRCAPGVQAAEDGETLWVRWDAGNDALALALLAWPGSTLYAWRDGHWYAPGHQLPSFEVHAGLPYRPLFQILFPDAVVPVPPRTRTEVAMTLTLRGDLRPRPASTLLCELAPLLRWADGVPASSLARLRGVRRGKQILVLGARLPTLAEGERYWGNRLLVPLGQAPEPALPEEALCEAAGLEPDEMLLLRPQGCEIFERALLLPLRRASLRLALQDAPP